MTDSPAKSGVGWTDAEKINLLLKMIHQLQHNGGKLDLNQVDMPGRTPKACTHVIAKMKAEAAMLVPGSGGSSARGKKNTAVPSTVPAGKKRKQDVKVEKAEEESEVDDVDTPSKKPRVTAKTNKTKKSTAAADDEDDYVGAIFDSEI